MVGLHPVEPSDFEMWLDRARHRMVALRAPGRADATEIVDELIERLLPAGPRSPDQHVLAGAAGEVWFTTGIDPVVLDLSGDPRALLTAVHQLAQAAGDAQMKVLVFPSQPALAEVTADLGYRTLATRMRLQPLYARPGKRPVVLEPLVGDAATAFVEDLLDEFAADLLSSGTATDPAAAHVAAQAQTDMALAEPGSVVLAGRAGGEQVGALWLDLDGEETFVLDIKVGPAHRGRGHGRALMVATEDFARSHGCTAVALSVFGNNPLARGLYDSLGYQVTETFLGVDLAAVPVRD